jgi:hypothetical protein
MKLSLTAFLLSLALCQCTSPYATVPTSSPPLPTTSTSTTNTVARDVPTWSIQYEGTIVARGKDYHIIDLFDSTEADVATLKSKGTRPIAYFSSQYENWRPDSARFPQADIGNSLDGWKGERWINPRSAAVRQIMLDRMDMASRKGFYGIDMDNVDFYEFSNGFGSTPADALDYVTFLANAAHARGLKFGLKNATGIILQTRHLIDYYINEEAHQYQEADAYASVSKPVFNIEYKPLTRGTPGIYTIYKAGAVMERRDAHV